MQGGSVMSRSRETAGNRWTGQDLCMDFGLSLEALQYFEQRGLVAPRRQSGEAVYGPKDRLRVEVIVKGRKLGFSLDEIARLISANTST